jgi:hypothetical protein
MAERLCRHYWEDYVLSTHSVRSTTARSPWPPEVSLEDGLASTYAWIKEQLERRSP